MAEAAEAGGAAAIRAEGVDDVRNIKRAVGIPVLGLIKMPSEQTPVIITPLLQHIEDLLQAGADMIAVDATMRRRSDGLTGPEFISRAREFGVPLLADIDDLPSAVAAEQAGADAISTTLAGYTGGAVPLHPDIALVAACAEVCTVPIVAEGRYSVPAEVASAFAAGAWAVCVGTAITDPWSLTRRFTAAG